MTMSEAGDQLIPINGVNAVTGSYGVEGLTVQKLASIIKGNNKENKLSDEEALSLEDKSRAGILGGAFASTAEDPNDLTRNGWGVIFAHADKDKISAIREALSPLLTYRRKQAGGPYRKAADGSYEEGHYYREFIGPDAYRPGETAQQFLKRHGIGFGIVDPQKGVPYYLLIVGNPESIPYAFQYQLDVQFAVGRIWFGPDNLDAYDHYARSVVAAECGAVFLPENATFFGVTNPDDAATALSTSNLVLPLADFLKEEEDLPGWNIASVTRDEATKARLEQLLGGSDTPTFLFTASHGMEFPNGHAKQEPHQGALLCQDWPGPHEWRKEIPQDFYFAGDDIASDARLMGMMAFFFACYGAGTPLLDDFSRQANKERTAIAPHAFLANLPQRMLGHPKGGALAVVGHIERAWGYSFMIQHHEESKQRQLQTFETTLKNLLQGDRLGNVFDPFNGRYASVGTALNSVLGKIEFGEEVSPVELATLWTTHHDARNYVVIGDPAVRLPLADGAAAFERPTLETVTLPDFTKVVDNQALAAAKAELEEARQAVEAAEKQLEEARERYDDAAARVISLGGEI